MIKKLLEVKNLGLFDNYHWGSNMPDFNRFNVLYGWNGSGKTTLSLLFSALSDGELEQFPDLKYKVETDDGEITQGMQYSRRIRVFNQHYVSQNIDTSSCKANPIYILGEENKMLAESIKKDELMLSGDPDVPGDLGLIKESGLQDNARKQKEKERDNLFSSVAKTIGTVMTGVSPRDYRKNNAEKDFNLLSSKRLLSQQEIDLYVSTLKQQELGSISLLSQDGVEKRGKELLAEITHLLSKIVTVTTITRLKENPEISQWVEEGLILHQHEKSQKCEFCNQALPIERMETLKGYFNKEDNLLKSEIDSLLQRLQVVKQSIQKTVAIDKANLFSEFQHEYEACNRQFESAKQQLLVRISQVYKETENKKLHTTERQELIGELPLGSFISAINDLNKVIERHNEKSRNFARAKSTAQESLKFHYLSEMYDEVQAINTDIQDIDKTISILKEGNPDDPDSIGIIGLRQRIDINKNKISQSGLACDEINRQLETFLGRRELIFETCDEGYVIKRNGKLANNLSEGEKTAVAFVYFTIHLKDRDFNHQNDIVIIDDPISSLDSNSLFQAFSFLKNSVKVCYQVFIFTHNFDFLQLVINWFKHGPKRESEYYMVKNITKDDKRVATLDNLDKLLLNYTSEYQYLFKILYTYQPDGTIESVYHLPNIARKVLDNFLMIMVPDSTSQYQKLERIPFDVNKKTAIYKFTNDQSHITGKGFDPSLSSECMNVTSYLIEMMKIVFPQHFDILVETVKDHDH